MESEMEIKPNLTCPVNSHNEWDPLEEVIVGSLDGAMFASWDPIYKLIFSDEERIEIRSLARLNAPFPREYVEPAKKDLEEFVHILESEGVTVRRTDKADYSAPFTTPDWQIPCGFSGTNPRDPFLVIGNEIIETPMPVRCRYFEAWAYRSLFKEYFKGGAKWTAAPKPQLLDLLYDQNYPSRAINDDPFCLTEFEPVFDGADFIRCGRDIFGQLSHVTNMSGVEWLQRHIGDGYRIHLIKNLDPKAIHIDTALIPLSPGKVLVNPEFVDVKTLPNILKKWDILIAPKPVPYITRPRIMSDWISVNTLMLDEKRIIVEKRQEPLIQALKGWGFEPIPCPFENYYPFEGGFHCATLDIRRRGTLQSYF